MLDLTRRTLNGEKLYSIMKKAKLKFAKQTWVYSIPSRRQEGIMMKKKEEKDSKCEIEL